MPRCPAKELKPGDKVRIAAHEMSISRTVMRMINGEMRVVIISNGLGANSISLPANHKVRLLQ